MQVTKRQLRRLIKEELQSLNEQWGEKAGAAIGGAVETVVEGYFGFMADVAQRAALTAALTPVIGLYGVHAVTQVLKDMSELGQIQGIWERTGGGAQGVGAVIDAVARRLRDL